MYKGNYFELLKDLKINDLKIIFDKTLFKMLNVKFEKITLYKILLFIFLNSICIAAVYLCYISKNIFLIIIPIAIMFSLLAIFIEKGIIINKATNSFMIFKSFLGIRIKGNWQLLPNSQYISIFKTRLIQEDNYKVPSTKNYYDVLQINIFDMDNLCTTLLNADSLTDAKKVAYQIASYLKLPLLDATEAENKWINTL